jgi:methionine aminotransferase
MGLVSHYMNEGFNQYAPMAGLLSLRERIVKKQEKLHQAIYHPETEITITAGGTQALFASIACTIREDDEVIIFEPAYDSYGPVVKLFGGKVRSIELNAPDYSINWDEVKGLINHKTKMIILNNPNNPTGRVLEENDIKKLIEITRDSPIFILSDEVYEHLIYDEKKHLSLSKYPELKERTFIIASFGKLLHATGWKIGYCLAPENMMKEFRKIHQFEVFSVNSFIQHAISDFLKNEANYLEINDFFQKKKDFFHNLMLQTRFDLLTCHGSYFQTVQYKRISDEKDSDLAVRMIKEFGVACIPVSAFYTRNTEQHVLRFCFAKKNETLEKAVNYLIKV